LAVGFSRPSMAVASRLLCPTNSGVTHCATKAWWTCSPRPISANSPKAREKVDSEGTSARRTKPQLRPTDKFLDLDHFQDAD